MPFPPLVEPVAALSDRERIRTARHARLAGLGEEGQRRLAAARIAIVGAGGLGSPAVLALAAAGVGTLTVIDDDSVELSNLQRQVLHRLEDVGAPKVDSAVRAASELSPHTRVIPIREHLDPGSAARLLAGADLVLDGSDTFDTREAVASACESLGVPLVWGTVQEFHAQVTVFWSAPPEGAEPVRLADLHPPGSAGDAPTCAAVGVLGPLCLQVGSLMAIEAVKLVAGIGEPLLGRILLVDALDGTTRVVPLRAAQTAPRPVTRPSVPAVGADALDGAVILDVREADEVAGGVIPGARHVPLADLLAAPGVFEGRVVVVCQTSVRARRGAEALRAAGVDAAVLAGGMAAWSGPTVPAAAPAVAR